MSLLEISNLNVAFGTTRAVHNVSLRLQKGERFGLIGESGSGKTMTALAIAGLLPRGATSTGTITLDGTPLPTDERAMAHLRGRHIGMVFQEPMTALNPLMRIAAQIAETITLNRPDRNANAEVPRLLAEVGLEPSHGVRFPHQLSGGQRQRVMIAIALAAEPDLLIADEPTSALDLITQRKVLDLIATLCARRSMPLLFISHDLRAVAHLCTSVAVMHRGEIVETGATHSVFSAPTKPYTQKLVAAARTPDGPSARPKIGDELLSVRNITRKFAQPGRLFAPSPQIIAVNDVSLSIRSGQSLALVGPSGCGKSTLARMIVGLDRANSGSMIFAGQTYTGTDLPKSLRPDISLVFQDPFGSFDPRLTIGDAIGEPLRLITAQTTSQKTTKIIAAIKAVGLHPDMAKRYPHEFSGGQRQRLAIARALVTRPKLLVLDEPVSALDMSVRGDVLALLAQLQSDFGLTYLIVSHDLEMVCAIADHILVMEAGKIVETGTPDAIFNAPQHRLTQALIAARLPDIVSANT